MWPRCAEPACLLRAGNSPDTSFAEVLVKLQAMIDFVQTQTSIRADLRIPGGEFRLPSGTSVVHGAGSVEQLRQKVEELGAKHAFVVTGRTIATKTDLMQRVRNVLGDRYAGVFSDVVQHVPRQCIVEGARLARQAGADLLVSLGGSSASDAAKGMNLALTEVERIEDFFIKFGRSDTVMTPEFGKPKLPQIAIPTTLSAGELTAGVGITDTIRRHKDVYRDHKLTPRTIILDPEVTAFTPRRLWAGTGMKLFSDRLGMVCSARPLPFAEALGLHALRLINRYIVRSVSEPLDLEARAMLLHAVTLSAHGVGAAGSGGLGMVAAIRHQMGAACDVAHGEASTIVLPYCITFNRPAIDERLAVAARALDLPIRRDTRRTASAVISKVRRLTVELGLPTRLRDVAVPREGIEIIAEASMHDTSIQNNFSPISKEQLLNLLEQSW